MKLEKNLKNYFRTDFKINFFKMHCDQILDFHPFSKKKKFRKTIERKKIFFPE